MAEAEVVTIGSEPFNSYATVAQADTYLAASFAASAWRASSDENKAMALVTATRTLDRQRWRGNKTDDDQPLAWPREATGVTGVEDDVIPDNIQMAAIEMAAALTDGSDFLNEQNTAQKIQSLRAGSVSISYFRGAEGAPLRFPLVIQELIGPYLAGGASSISLGVLATGTDGESVTAEDFGHSDAL